MRRRRGSWLTALFAASLCLWTSSAAAADLELRFVDVGQGDAVLIRNGGHAALIDTGVSDRIVGRLADLGVTSLDILIISHNHQDHLGGADAVLSQLKVAKFMDNGLPAKSKLEAVVLDLVDRHHVALIAATPRSLPLGDAHLAILPPAPQVGGDEQNNASVGVILERGRFHALMTGDSEVEEINHWLAAAVIPEVDVLKAAHHGSRNGLTPLWLHRTKPKVVVISVGAGNPYGHPHPMALRYYQAGGRQVLRTDENGDVVVTVAPDGAYRVTSERAAALATSTPVPAARPTAAPATQRRACCHVCRKGKPCGNSCIAQGASCSKAPGCACAAQVVR